MDSSLIAMEQQQQQHFTSVFDYLKSQSRIVLDRLYNNENNTESQWACTAVFQWTSMLSRCYIMRMLFLSSFTLSDVTIWCRPDQVEHHNKSIEELTSLRIIVEVLTHEKETEYLAPPREQLYRINPYFRDSLKLGMVKTQKPLLAADDATNASVPEEFLNSFCEDSWNEVLGILVNIMPKNYQLSSAVESFVKAAGLMSVKVSRTGKETLTITSLGYEYMLKSYDNQIWEFVQQAMNNSENVADMLGLLFMLSYCQPGAACSMKLLTSSQKTLILNFFDIGLVYMNPQAPDLFFPTKAVVNMIFNESTRNRDGADGGGTGSGASTKVVVDVPRQVLSKQKLSLIVETNYQVIAYVESDLYLAILKLFVEVTLRFPNMVVGCLSREKARSAFRTGIKATQIAEFLTVHAHEQMKQRTPIVPDNVVHQLQLWEAEDHRINAQEACVIDFREIPGATRELFAKLVEYLLGVKVLLWHSMPNMIVAVEAENGLQFVHSFVQQTQS